MSAVHTMCAWKMCYKIDRQLSKERKAFTCSLHISQPTIIIVWQYIEIIKRRWHEKKKCTRNDIDTKCIMSMCNKHVVLSHGGGGKATQNVNGEVKMMTSLQWRHDDHDGVSNHQPNSCLLNRLFRCRSKKTSKLRVTGLCVGNSPGPVNSPHKWPVTRKMLPFDDVIMRAAPTWWKNAGYSLRGDFELTGLILGLRPVNERRRYFVMTSLIGWAQA